MKLANRVKSGVAVAGAAVGRSISLFLVAGNWLLGELISRVFSTRLQHVWFTVVARFNAVMVLLVSLVALHYLGRAYPHSSVVTSLGLLAVLLPAGMWVRLAPKASLLVSSVWGWQLRVHLPVSQLSTRDVTSFREQFDVLVGIARRARAKTLHFDSPLLVADPTRLRLIRYLGNAASAQGVRVTFDVAEPREVDAIAQGSLSVLEERYDVLRKGRIAKGPSGRLLSCKVLVRMQYV
jgi:hypothetical protein